MNTMLEKLKQDRDRLVESYIVDDKITFTKDQFERFILLVQSGVLMYTSINMSEMLYEFRKQEGSGE